MDSNVNVPSDDDRGQQDVDANVTDSSSPVDGNISSPALDSLQLLNPIEPNTGMPGLQWVKLGDDQVELFMPGGPTANEVLHPDLSDCTVFAALSSLVSVSPERVRNMVTLEGKTFDGALVYAVALHNNETGKTEKIYVDEKIYASVNLPRNFRYDRLYADPQNGKIVLWPSIIQKAFAVYHGGYEAIKPYQDIEMFVLTGQVAKILLFPGSAQGKPTFVVDRLREYVGRGYVVTVGSFLFTEGQANDDSDTPVTTYGLFNCALVFGEQFCLAQSHAYEVVAVDGNNVIVRNPWGFNRTFADSANGKVTIPMQAYSALTEVTWSSSLPVTSWAQQ